MKTETNSKPTAADLTAALDRARYAARRLGALTMDPTASESDVAAMRRESEQASAALDALRALAAL